MKSLLVLYCVTGLFGYYLMYYTQLPDIVKWDLHFVLDKIMKLFLIIALFFPTKGTRILKWVVLIGAVLDLASEFDQIKQQGNYVQLFAHSFGVVMFAGVAWAIGENKFSGIANNIKEWFKSRRNG
jgi:hypothetical protein